MPSPDCIRKSLRKSWLRDDDDYDAGILCDTPTCQERQYTLFIYNSGLLLADEHRLLHQTEADRHPRRVDYCHRICDASIGWWCGDRCLDLSLAGDDDLLGDAFSGLTKRNDDYRIYEQTGVKPRVSITGYNKTFINEATAIIGAVTLVCYIMYTMSPEVIERMGTRYVYLTSGWVLAGLLRYLQNMIVFGLSGSPTKSLVKDHFVQFCIIGWIASFFVIIYL